MLDGSLTSVAFCWRLERSDGAGVALTSADQPIDQSSLRFEAAPGMVPASFERRIGLDASSAEVSGAVTSAALTDADLSAGRWDGAAFSLSAADWADPAAEHVPLAAGRLGEIAVEDDRFTAELHGAAKRLDAPFCPVTSPTCRAAFGDDRCRVDLAGRSVRARIVEVTAERLLLDTVVDERFLLGRLRFLSGPNCGLASAIIATDASGLTIRDSLAGQIAVGNTVEIREGCDKRFETCCERFDNAVNFRGEPHVPGNDLLTRYPGA